jgi:hypothetical protein
MGNDEDAVMKKPFVVELKCKPDEVVAIAR